jgi:RNA polymerase sigma-70 factor, ECF subfamily
MSAISAVIEKSSDEVIAQKVQRGELEIFATLIQRYQAKMLRYARKFLFNQQDAEDLIQEVFLKAYINIKSFDSQRKFSSWLYRIAHNEFINALKKKGKEPLPFFDADTLFPHPIAPEATDKKLQADELRQLLNQGLDKLASKYREPLILYYLEELSYKEISEILHIPVSTVGIRLNRAKQAMQKIIKKLNYKI